MRGLLRFAFRLVTDRGFWVDSTPLLTLLITQLFKVSGDTAIKWIGAAQVACIGINRCTAKAATPTPNSGATP